MPETVRNLDDPTGDDDEKGGTTGEGTAAADEPGDDEAGGGGWRLVKVEGTVTVDGKSAKVGTEVGPTSSLETGKKGYAVLTIGGKSVIEIRAKTKLSLGKSKSAEISLELLLGAVWSFIDEGTKYEVVTNNGTAGVRGTVFFVQTKNKKKSYICACQGSMQITAKNGKSFDEVITSPSNDHKAFTVVSKKKKQKVKKTKRKFHTDDEKMALMGIIDQL